MLKRVDSARLRTGVYLHKLGGSWLQHPFWKTSFLITTPAEIASIHESGIKEVWIDTARGLDIEEERTETAVITVEPQVSAEPVTVHDDNRRPATLAEEAERAARICAEAKGFVVDMFQEARMGRAVAARDALPLVNEITDSVARNRHALISIARLKTADDYTYMHSVAVCGLMIALARQLQMSEDDTREAGLAGLLHDVGKMGVPMEVLNKPGKLTAAEFALMRAHPAHGFRMLHRSPGITETALDVCLHHHEKVDGTGYPHQLNAESISEAARMGAVCDVYDAITSNRAYKSGWSPVESIRRMAEWSNGHFDNRIFQAFVKTVGIYPVGVLVRLKSERLGVVVGRSTDSLLAPQVKIFYSAKQKKLLRESIIDLAVDSGDSIISHEDPAAWGFADLQTMWQTPAPGA